MKRILTILMLSVASVAVKAQVKVLGRIVPNSVIDTYPTHTDSLGRGGLIAVATWQERNSIPLPRRKSGMLVRVKSATVDSTYTIGGVLSNADWIAYNAGLPDMSSYARVNAGNQFVFDNSVKGAVFNFTPSSGTYPDIRVGSAAVTARSSVNVYTDIRANQIVSTDGVRRSNMNSSKIIFSNSSGDDYNVNSPATLSTGSVNMNFPAKNAGTYTLATTADLPSPVDVSDKEDKTNKVNTLASPNNTTYPTTLTVSNGLAAKADVSSLAGKANTNGSNATGTWGINTSGSAAQWNGFGYGGSAATSGLSQLVGYDSSTGTMKFFQNSYVKSELGLPASGGYDLPSITARGNNTTDKIISPDFGLRYADGNSFQGIKRNAVLTEYYNGNTGSDVVLHSFTGTGNTSLLDIYNGGRVIAAGAIQGGSLITPNLKVKNADGGTYKEFVYQQNGLNRWNLYSDIAETGSDAGSNLYLASYDDAGNYKSSIFNVNRATGNLLITSNVGIGVPVASTALQARSESTTQPTGYIYNPSTTAGQSRGLAVEGGTNSSDYSAVFNRSNGDRILTLRGDGNVGIGTTTPSEKFHVNGGNIRVTSNDGIAILKGGELTLGTNEGLPSRLVMGNTVIEDVAPAPVTLGLPMNDGVIATTSDIPKMLLLQETGDSITGIFSIAHGLSYTPTMVLATANSVDAAYIVNGSNSKSRPIVAYADATNVYVNCMLPDGGPTGIVPFDGATLKWTIMVK